MLQCLLMLAGVNILCRNYEPTKWWLWSNTILGSVLMKKLLPRTFIACFGIFSVIPILIGYMIVNIDTLNLVQITEPIVTLRKLYLNFSLTFLNKNLPNTQKWFIRDCARTWYQWLDVVWNGNRYLTELKKKGILKTFGMFHHCSRKIYL